MMSLKKDVHNDKIKNIEGKMPNVTNIATNAFLHVKINKLKVEIPNITN